MTVKKAVAHEVWCQRRNCNLQVASFAEKKSVDGLLSSQWWANSSAENVASRREGLEAAEKDEEAGSLHGLLDNRSERNGNTTSMHREGTVFERNDDDDDEDEDDDEDDVDDDGDGDDDDDGSDDDDDNNNDIDASRRERM